MMAVTRASADRPFLRRVRTAMTLARLATLYLFFSVMKRAVPTSTLARWAWQEPRGARDGRAEDRAVRTVVALRRRLGHDDDCLQAALVLYRELSRAGASPRLAVGFAHETAGLKPRGYVNTTRRSRRASARRVSAGPKPCGYADTNVESALVGHAWVEVDGQPVAEDRAAIARHVVAARFGARGATSPCR